MQQETYNEDQYNDIPRCINNVHLPSDVTQSNWHDECEDETVKY